MTSATPLTLTPEQVAALNEARDGVAYAFDPVTQRRYALLDCQVEATHSTEYLRTLIAEGIAELDRGEAIPWDVDELKRQVAERLSQRTS